jgi:hypothetical protein
MIHVGTLRLGPARRRQALRLRGGLRFVKRPGGRPSFRGLAGFGDTGDPIFAWSPSDVAALADTVSREIEAIGAAVTTAWADGKLSSAQRAPWKVFYDEWHRFNDSRTWLGDAFITISGNVTTLKKYRQQAREWAEKLAPAGITPAIPIPAPAPPGSEDDWKKYLKWGLGVAALVAVAQIAGPAISGISSLTRRGP